MTRDSHNSSHGEAVIFQVVSVSNYIDGIFIGNRLLITVVMRIGLVSEFVIHRRPVLHTDVSLESRE